MPTRKWNRTPETRLIDKLLRAHFPEYPAGYPPMAYRYNSASIRVRVVSEAFVGMDRVDRSDVVYPILEKNLPRDTWEDITIILLLAPDELEDSLMNFEFERPTPSRI